MKPQRRHATSISAVHVPQRPCLVWFVSPHGLGHLSRVGQVIREFGDEFRHVVFWRKDTGMAGRFLDVSQVELHDNVWDCEPIQDGPGRIDEAATGRSVDALMRNQLPCETEIRAVLQAHAAVGVICDITPLPLRVAQQMGIPAIFAGNFTWFDIMQRFGRNDKTWARRLAWLRECYRSADLAVKPGLDFAMPYLRSETLPIIARRGRERRRELRAIAGARKGEQVALLYFGVWGAADFDAARALSTLGWRFVAMTEVPAPALELDGREWAFPDVLASADAVVAKLGYGTVGEAMANRCPIVYYPRPEFSESRILARAIAQGGFGVGMSTREFREGRWQRALSFALRMPKPTMKTNGARAMADRIRGFLAPKI